LSQFGNPIARAGIPERPFAGPEVAQVVDVGALHHRLVALGGGQRRDLDEEFPLAVIAAVERVAGEGRIFELSGL
jgi:hypothetical protein